MDPRAGHFLVFSGERDKERETRAEEPQTQDPTWGNPGSCVEGW